jgi:hypothetical protein
MDWICQSCTQNIAVVNKIVMINDQTITPFHDPVENLSQQGSGLNSPTFRLNYDMDVMKDSNGSDTNNFAHSMRSMENSLSLTYGQNSIVSRNELTSNVDGNSQNDHSQQLAPCEVSVPSNAQLICGEKCDGDLSSEVVHSLEIENSRVELYNCNECHKPSNDADSMMKCNTCNIYFHNECIPRMNILSVDYFRDGFPCENCMIKAVDHYNRNNHLGTTSPDTVRLLQAIGLIQNHRRSIRAKSDGNTSASISVTSPDKKDNPVIRNDLTAIPSLTNEEQELCHRNVLEVSVS